MKRTAAASTLFALALMLAPLPSLAASKPTFLGPIVPAECHCDNQVVQGGGGTATTAPDYGCVLQVIQNLINFGVTLSIILSTIYLVITGLSFMTSGGSSEARSKAKTRFTNVFVGLAVLLCSWLIIDFVMKTLYDAGKFGPWNSILAGKPDNSDRCIIARQPSAITSGTVGILTGPAPGTGGTVITGGIGKSGLNTGTAATYALQHANGSSGNQCALYVRQALAAGGLTSFNASHPGFAYQYGPYLNKAGFSVVQSGTYSSGLEGNISGLQPGDVVVFQPVPGHSSGHIAIYTGNQWVSDFVQKNMSPAANYAGGSYAIYRP